MEGSTGFNFMLNKEEMKNLYNYLHTTVGWLCLSTGNYDKSCDKFCCICEIYKPYKEIYNNSYLTNFEKCVFIKRMFKSMKVKGGQEFPYFCAIFKDMKKKLDH